MRRRDRLESPSLDNAEEEESTMNGQPTSPQAHRTPRWNITRRDCLKASACALAGLALEAPPAYARNTSRKPVLRFGMVADAHYADRDDGGGRAYRQSLEKMASCVDLMNEQKVEFLINLGDLKDQRKSATEESTLEFLKKIERVFRQYHGPRYHVLGNHDMDSISKEQFLHHVEMTKIPKGRSYYSFDAKALHFIVLDANYTSKGEDYSRGNFHWKDTHVPAQQLAWLKKDLAASTKPAVVFVHQQLTGESAHCIRNAAEVRQVLEDSKKVLAGFHGHNHGGGYQQIENIHYYTLKAMVQGKDNAFAIADVYADHSMTITGYHRAASRNLAAAGGA